MSGRPIARRRWLFAGVVIIFVTGEMLGAWAGLRGNISASMPIGIWRVEKLGMPRRGDVAAVCLPAALLGEGLTRGYVSGGRCPGGAEPLLKPLAAVPGDVVVVTPDGLMVNGEPLPASAALDRDEAGRPLRSVPPGSYRVRPGEVWLVSGHSPLSWDSRYYGAVPVSALIGEVHPLWVFR